jgi:hypothetical protein
MNVVAKIKARVGLPEIAAVLGLGFPSRIGCKFCSLFSRTITISVGVGARKVNFQDGKNSGRD